MNATEIVEQLKQITTVEEFAYEDWTTNEILGNCTEVDQHGGENEGSDWYSIKHFTDHDVYLKVSGWYQSHYGTDFNDWDEAVKEVKPKERKVTFYE